MRWGECRVGSGSLVGGGFGFGGGKRRCGRCLRLGSRLKREGEGDLFHGGREDFNRVP